MSAELATKFFCVVRSNPDTVARLSGCLNSEEFIERAVVLGGEMGYPLTRDDIAAALRQAQSACSANASELDDDDLDMIQAAGAWEMLIKPQMPAG